MLAVEGEPAAKMSRTQSSSERVAEFINTIRYSRQSGTDVTIEIPASLPRVELSNRLLNTMHCDLLESKLVIRFEGGGKTDVEDATKGDMRAQHGAGWTSGKISVRWPGAPNGVYVEADGAYWTAARHPTRAQKNHPLRNNLPHPDGWQEIVINRDPDRQNAFDKVQNILIPQFGAGMDIWVIALPDSDNAPAGGAGGAASTPAAPHANRPARSPWVAVWTIGTAFGGVQYYDVTWDEHVVIGNFQLEFNTILQALQ